jgi:YbbR domain-containing protein
MKTNWRYRLLAIILTLLCWYVVSGQEKVESWLEIPLEYVNLPQGMKITSATSKVQIRIRGTSSQVRSVNVNRLAYKVDLSHIRAGMNVIPLLPENISTVSAVDVVEVSPNRLELTADTLISRTIPVHLDWEGRPAEDMRFLNATVTPDQVTVKGFAHTLENLEHAVTVPVRVPAGDALTASGQAQLVLPEGVSSETTSVNYALEFTYVTQSIWVKLDLEPVEYKEFTYSFDPQFVRMHLDIPIRLLKDKNWREALRLSLNPGLEPPLGPSRVRPVTKFPAGVNVLESKPEDVEIFVRQIEESDR